MRILDSRRLTGPSLLLDSPGAVLDVYLEDLDPDRAAGAWRQSAGRLLHALGWIGQELASRCFPGGMSLAFTAPVDALYAATEVNEKAWTAALAQLRGQADTDVE